MIEQILAWTAIIGFLFCLISSIATWVAIFVFRRRIARLETRKDRT